MFRSSLGVHKTSIPFACGLNLGASRVRVGPIRAPTAILNVGKLVCCAILTALSCTATSAHAKLDSGSFIHRHPLPSDCLKSSLTYWPALRLW